MALWLKAQAALTEDQGLVPSIHMAQSSVTPVLGDLRLSYDLCWHCTTWVHLHTYRQYTHTHKIKITKVGIKKKNMELERQLRG